MKEPHRKLLHDYDVGRITSTEFTLGLLHDANRDDLRELLDVIPSDLLSKLRDFVATYRPGMRVIRGSAPDPSAVSLVKELLASTIKTS